MYTLANQSVQGTALNHKYADVMTGKTYVQIKYAIIVIWVSGYDGDAYR